MKHSVCSVSLPPYSQMMSGLTFILSKAFWQALLAAIFVKKCADGDCSTQQTRNKLDIHHNNLIPTLIKLAESTAAKSRNVKTCEKCRLHVLHGLT